MSFKVYFSAFFSCKPGYSFQAGEGINTLFLQRRSLCPWVNGWERASRRLSQRVSYAHWSIVRPCVMYTEQKEKKYRKGERNFKLTPQHEPLKATVVLRGQDSHRHLHYTEAEACDRRTSWGVWLGGGHQLCLQAGWKLPRLCISVCPLHNRLSPSQSQTPAWAAFSMVPTGLSCYRLVRAYCLLLSFGEEADVERWPTCPRTHQ